MTKKIINRLTDASDSLVVEVTHEIDDNRRPTTKPVITVENTQTKCKVTLDNASPEAKMVAGFFTEGGIVGSKAGETLKFERLIVGTGISFIGTQNTTVEGVQTVAGDLSPLAKLVADPNSCQKGGPTR